MVKNTRVTYTKRNPYRTKSNTLKMVKTPGGRMAGHYRTKLAKGVRCGDCGTQLCGVRTLPARARRLSAARRVDRAQQPPARQPPCPAPAAATAGGAARAFADG